MITEDSLIILSVDTMDKIAASLDGISPMKLVVEHRNRRRTINDSYHLSKKDLEDLRSLLLSTSGICKRAGTLSIIEDVLELQYAISLLKELVLDFGVMDIVRLYKHNLTLLMPVVHLRKLIRNVRRINKKSEAQSYSALLKKLLGYSPRVVLMDVRMIDTDWFLGFRAYLQNTGCSAEEISDFLDLLWQVYVDTCRLSGAKVLCSLENGFERVSPGADFNCRLTETELEWLLKARIKDEHLLAARNLLLLKHWAGEIAFVDLLDLKMEDVHGDGIWYRRRRDNKLCFVSLPFNVVRVIRKKMCRGDNLLFRFPFEEMKDERKRLDLKSELYAKQLEKLVRLYPVALNRIE
ncbi:MAG: hypothetical protein H6Q13_1205 [Bacteroidetes bacterium]|jgi:hypothetical protein|nr:hypothetical protein [Bacteroidota bacterium]